MSGAAQINEQTKSEDIDELTEILKNLSPIQTEVVVSIVKRFLEKIDGELLINDFLTKDAFEYFGMRLAAHHASSSHMLKKENFEHIIEQSFRRTGSKTKRQNSMTVRGADIEINGSSISLKTEAARSIKPSHITISKLMEAAWIKRVTSTDDIPNYIRSMIMPHFSNYEKIFILRCYIDPSKKTNIRYDLREIPKAVLSEISRLTGADFTALTQTRTTSAQVHIGGHVAFKFRLDGSDDKITITNLDVSLCPLHAWWSLAAPTD